MDEFELDDGNGNTGTETCQVQVPINNGGTAVDDEPNYEVLGNCGDKSSFIAAIDNENIELRVYPNPFSSSTTIEYELKYSSIVQIIIFNHFGKQVDIIRDNQTKGLNKVIWTPGYLPNGIYYFRLQAGEKVASGKMVLMR